MNKEFLKPRRVRFLGLPLEDFLKQEVKELDEIAPISNIEISIDNSTPTTPEMQHLVQVDPVVSSTKEEKRFQNEFQKFSESSQINLSAFDVSLDDKIDTDEANSALEKEWKEFCLTRNSSD